MDAGPLLPSPLAAHDAVDRDLAEIDAAIGLIAAGVATRVCLVGLHDPTSVASAGLAHAQAARVRFGLDRGPNGSVALTLGPRS
jgi:hypothetical protein